MARFGLEPEVYFNLQDYVKFIRQQGTQQQTKSEPEGEG